MGSVWKRINRINKRASKFHFTASYSELWLEAGPNWQPTALSVIWTRKSRRVVSEPVKWEPTMKNPYIGMCVWPVPENKEITVTMFRDAHKDEYDNKDWFFILEDINPSGKRKPVAQGRLNMREFCTDVPTQSELTVKLRPVSKKVTAAKLSLTLTSKLIRSGKASDSDMISQVGEDEEQSPVHSPVREEISLITQQIQQLNKEDEQSNSPRPVLPPDKPRPVKTEIKDENENQRPTFGNNGNPWGREVLHSPWETDAGGGRRPEDISPAAGTRPSPSSTRTLTPAAEKNFPNPTTKESVSPGGAVRPTELVSTSQDRSRQSRSSFVESPKPPELDTRPRMIDDKAKVQSNSRGFSSREFKSAYNGPRGEYTQYNRQHSTTSNNKGETGRRDLESGMDPGEKGVSNGDVVREGSTLQRYSQVVSPASMENKHNEEKVSPPDKNNPPSAATRSSLLYTATRANPPSIELRSSPPTKALRSSPPSITPRSSPPVTTAMSSSSPPKELSSSSLSSVPRISPPRTAARSGPPPTLPRSSPPSTPPRSSPPCVTPRSSPPAPSPPSPPSQPMQTTDTKEDSPEEVPKASPADNLNSSTPVKMTPVIDEDTEENEEIILNQGSKQYMRTKSQEFRDYQAEFVLSSTIDFGPLSSPLPTRKGKEPQTTKPASPPPYLETSTPAAADSPSPPLMDTDTPPTPSHTKIEIAPSSSFLDNLNRNSFTVASSPSTSPSTPVSDNYDGFKRGGAATATMMRREKVLTDRTNSLLRQNTTSASEELLEWTKSVCAPYSNVKVTNFGTSWRNGLAFCAIIHSYYPGLIPYTRLNPHDIKDNCRLAFEAGERLGVARLIEPTDMVIKRIPDKLLVITYLHQLRSVLGKEETKLLYEQSQEDSNLASTGVRKSFSEGNIRLFSRGSSNDTESGLETIQESSSVADIKPEKMTEYRKRAATLVQLARSESRDLGEQVETKEEKVEEKGKENGMESAPPRVMMRQKSSTPKPRKDNRLSYIDNEIKVLDAEQIEIDKQAAILEKRLRETSEDDQLVYDALLQQFLTLVNKKNAIMKRQFQLNMLEKEEDLEKKLSMLQDELRALSELEDHRKTEEDRRREDLLLEELVLCVKKRDELVMQQDEEEKQILVDEALDQEVTAAENEHLRNNRREDCRMQ